MIVEFVDVAPSFQIMNAEVVVQTELSSSFWKNADGGQLLEMMRKYLPRGWIVLNDDPDKISYAPRLCVCKYPFLPARLIEL
jgi:hypothetical protein